MLDCIWNAIWMKYTSIDVRHNVGYGIDLYVQWIDIAYRSGVNQRSKIRLHNLQKQYIKTDESITKKLFMR